MANVTVCAATVRSAALGAGAEVVVACAGREVVPEGRVAMLIDGLLAGGVAPVTAWVPPAAGGVRFTAGPVSINIGSIERITAVSMVASPADGARIWIGRLWR
ncbi:MAG: hypothetical protein AMXMBFR13_07340 [Phycisphaerae bacterium]